MKYGAAKLAVIMRDLLERNAVMDGIVLSYGDNEAS